MRERIKLLTSVAVVAAWLLSAMPVAAQTGRVGGTVKDDSGQPIEGATVVAENPDSSPSSFEAKTDDKGRFSIIGLRSGTWTVTATAPGYLPASGRLPLRTIGAPNPPLDFTLEAGAPAGGGAFAGVNTKELQEELQAAEDMLAGGQYDQAITAYEAILVKTPTLTMINMQIGRAYRMKKEFDSALGAYMKILEAEPDNERAKIEIGMTNLEKGDLEAAETALGEAAQGMGASREVFYNLGEVKFAKGETEEAMSWYQRAIDTDPAWAKPYFKLGLGKLQQADMPGALEMMEKVIAAEPDSAEAAQAKALIEQLKKG